MDHVLRYQDDIERDGCGQSRLGTVSVPVITEQSGSNVWCLYIRDSKLYLTNGSAAARSQVSGISVVEVREGGQPRQELAYAKPVPGVSAKVLIITSYYISLNTTLYMRNIAV